MTCSCDPAEGGVVVFGNEIVGEFVGLRETGGGCSGSLSGCGMDRLCLGGTGGG